METIVHIASPDIKDANYLDNPCAKFMIEMLQNKGYQLDDNLNKLIEDETLNKKEQTQLVVAKEYDAEQIILFFDKSSQKGYKYMRKTFEKIPSNYIDEQIPLYATIKENGEVVQYGSSMSDKGVKNFILERKRTAVQIAYNEEHWHCFIFDYSGLAGREGGKQFNGVKHCHYISDKFGMQRDTLLKMLESFHHPSATIHMKLAYRKTQ